MLYKGIEIHNVAELDRYADGSVSWCRVPQYVYDTLEKGDQARHMAMHSTGVELRFVLQGEQAVLRMSASEDEGVFHVYRGSIQGGWMDHEVQKIVGAEPQDFVITRSQNQEHLEAMTQHCEHPFGSEVIRVIFDRGFFRLYDVQGDVRPPLPEECPESTLLCYGSSITHGSNSIDMSHAWPSVLGYNLKMDVRNLGMAGSCALEPAFADYIASEGEKGNWDAAVLELGINVLSWEAEKIQQRVSNMVRQVAGRNPDKKVFVISPFYHCGDDFSEQKNAVKWRAVTEETVKNLNYPNVTYINGMDVIGNMSYMSADEVHPNIYGVQKIADRLTEIMAPVLGKAHKPVQKKSQRKIRPLWIGVAAVAAALAILLGSFAFSGPRTKTLYLPETVEYVVDGEVYSTDEYIYDDNGFLKEIVIRQLSGKENRTQVTCDDYGNVLRVTQEATLNWDLAKSTYTTTTERIYAYSARGNLLSDSIYRDGVLANRTDWEYDPFNRLTSRTVSSNNAAGQTVQTVTQYEYDDDGKLIAARMFMGGELRSTTAFSYDEEGKLLLEEQVNGNGTVLSRAQYTYENGNTVVKVANAASQNGNVTIHIYDHAGNLIRRKWTAGTGGYYQYTYTYREVEVSKDSPRQSFSLNDNLPKTGLLG